MKRYIKKGKLLAAVLAAGIVFSMPGFTSAAGTLGLGSYDESQHTGPGMADQGHGSQGQAQPPAQTEGQGNGDQGQAQPPAQTEGQGNGDQGQAQPPAETEGQGNGDQGQAQPPAQTEGQGNGSQGQAQPPDQTEDAQPPLQVNYSAFMDQQGWSAVTADNHPCVAGAGSWVSAMKANLINIPENDQIGVRYKVNLSGSGWLDWQEDGAQAGGPKGAMPLESICMELTGTSAANYDLYYEVYQNGSWTGWASNGASAGVAGEGLRVDGIRASITAKGAGVPKDLPAAGASIDPSKPMIALTFDDGPRTSVTSRILDSLKANGGRATFFMVGSNVNSNKDVIRRMVAQGCEVGNHTHDHKYLTKLNDQQIRSQVGSTNDKIEAVCGVRPTLVRPPGGYIDSHSLSVLGSMGMSAIMWSIDTRDWQHRNAQKSIDMVLSHVKDGDIILMHDIYPTSADAAVVLIPELTARGYQLVTVSELASYRGGIQPGHKYSQFR